MFDLRSRSKGLIPEYSSTKEINKSSATTVAWKQAKWFEASLSVTVLVFKSKYQLELDGFTFNLTKMF